MESDGITLALWLDRSEITIGDSVLGLVRLTNNRQEAVVQETNACAWAPATTTVIQNDTSDALAFGIDWPGRAGIFKRALITEAGLGHKRELGTFLDSAVLGGRMDCGRSNRRLAFQPGLSHDIHLTWPVVPRLGSVIVPGRALVDSTFTTEYWEFVNNSSPQLKVTTETEITIVAAPGSDPSPIGLTLVDYADAALSVAQFRDWIDNAGSGVFFTPSYNFTTAAVEIRATLPNTSGDEDPELHSVVVNRATGVVMSYR